MLDEVDKFQIIMPVGRMIVYPKQIGNTDRKFKFFICYQPKGNTDGQQYLHKDGKWEEPGNSPKGIRFFANPSKACMFAAEYCRALSFPP